MFPTRPLLVVFKKTGELQEGLCLECVCVWWCPKVLANRCQMDGVWSQAPNRFLFPTTPQVAGFGTSRGVCPG